MSNDYLPDETPLAPGDLARSDDVNTRYEGTVSAFDKLPAPAVGEKGFGDPCPVGTPTADNHAATKAYVDSNTGAEAIAAAQASETNSASNNTYASEWAVKAEDSLVSAAAGGNEVDDYSALHHAAKAAATVATIDEPSIARKNETQTFTGAQKTSVTALADGATIAPDFSANNNFSVTLGGNRTLANPTNIVAGQTGYIAITQDGTGSRTLALGAYWKTLSAGGVTLSTAANSVDTLEYRVRSATEIDIILNKDWS